MRQYLFLFLLASITAGCSSSDSRPNSYRSNDDTRPLVDDKYKLTADREKFDEARAQISSDKKLENDEIAFVMQLMSDPSKEPSNVKDKFDSELRKKREHFSKDIQKERDEFTKKEHKDRDSFLKGMKLERKDFLRSKHTKDERDEFFNQQEEKRKDYFETQRERRNDFEADISERRKDFEDYARGKSSEFLQEYRAFQRRHDDYEKNKEKEKQKKESERTGSSPSSASGSTTNEPTPEVKSFLQEFMDIPSAPGSSLESGQ